MTQCWVCGSKMIWQNNFDYEDYNIFEEEGVVSVLQCSNDKCDTHAEFYHTINA